MLIFLKMFFIFLLPSMAFAEVPFIFEPNTKAIASEVNGNFSQLDKNITLVEGTAQNNTALYNNQQLLLDKHRQRLDGLDATRKVCPNTDNGFGVTYTKKSLTAGAFITPEYVMIKVPFLEFKSGNSYTITLPAYLSVGPNQQFIYTALVFKPVDKLAFCTTLLIDNFQSSSHFVNTQRRMDLQGGGAINKTSTSTTLMVKILVENTEVSFWYTKSDYEQPGFQIPADTYDLTTIIDASYQMPPFATVQLFDELIDYIEIAKSGAIPVF